MCEYDLCIVQRRIDKDFGDKRTIDGGVLVQKRRLLCAHIDRNVGKREKVEVPVIRSAKVCPCAIGKEQVWILLCPCKLQRDRDRWSVCRKGQWRCGLGGGVSRRARKLQRCRCVLRSRLRGNRGRRKGQCRCDLGGVLRGARRLQRCRCALSRRESQCRCDLGRGVLKRSQTAKVPLCSLQSSEGQRSRRKWSGSQWVETVQQLRSSSTIVDTFTFFQLKK